MRLNRCAVLVTGFVGLACFGGEVTRAEEKAPVVRDLSVLLEKGRRREGFPAVAAVVVRSDGIVAQGVTGVRKLGDATLAARGDRWHLGSCTKAITATMIGVLVERGELSWDTTIASAFPNLGRTTREAYADVTIEMLLQHRGRISAEPNVPGLWDRLWMRKGTPVQERRLMTRPVLSQEPVIPRGRFVYSNFGYGIAGHMAETITGKPWEQLVRELVFEPLGMKSAGFGVPWADEPPTDPWPHKADGTVITPGPMADNPPSIGPAGSIHASIEDWAKFIRVHLQGARGEDTSLLKASTFKRLHAGKPSGIGEAYAMGWKVLKRPWAAKRGTHKPGPCLHHTGSNNSWYASVWIAPERDFAILVTTNMGGDGVFPKVDRIVSDVGQDYTKTLRR